MHYIFWIVFLLTGCASNNISRTSAVVEDKSMAYTAKASQYLSDDEYEGSTIIDSSKAPTFDRVIYFDYDSAVVLKEYDDILVKVSTYLINNPQIKIVLEGHTDERGTRDYNLALGEKRANSVLKQLNILGVPRMQMKSLSFGEENPSALGVEDAILALNRRVEIIY